jgi:excisionase family DNA binding protein
MSASRPDPALAAALAALRAATAALEQLAAAPAAPAPAGPRWLRAREVAARLGLSADQIYAMIARGELPSVRVGRAVRVPEDALARWLAARTSPGGRG